MSPSRRTSVAPGTATPCPSREIASTVDESKDVDRVGVDLVDQAIALHEDFADGLFTDFRIAAAAFGEDGERSRGVAGRVEQSVRVVA